MLRKRNRKHIHDPTPTPQRAPARDNTNVKALNPGLWAADYVGATSYQESPTVAYYHGQFWLWKRSHPWYRAVSRDDFTPQVLNWLRSTGRTADLRDAQAVVANIAGLTYVDPDTAMPTWLCETTRPSTYIALRNGLIDPVALATGRTDEFLPPTPTWFSPTFLPYRYDPHAECPLIVDWLTRRFPEPEAREFLQEWCGYLLTPDYSRQTGLLLYGREGTGKSTFGRLLTQLLGEKNVSSVNLTSWGEKHSLADVAGTMLCISDELPEGKIPARAERVIKEWIGGSAVTVEPKFLKQYKVEPLARVVLMMNSWPQFRDTSGAIWRRWRVVNCDEHIPRDQYDFGLELRMHAETPGMFNWALRGLQRLVRNDHWTLVPSGEAELLRARGETQNHRQFIKDCIKVSDSHFISWEKLYAAYRRWCTANGYEPFANKRTFGDDLCGLIAECQRSTQRSGGTVKRGFKNIGVRT